MPFGGLGKSADAPHVDNSNAPAKDAPGRGHRFEKVSIGDFARAHLGDHHGDVYNIAGDYHAHAKGLQEGASPGIPEKARCLLKWLRFSRQTHRKETIQQAHDETFEWIFDETTTAATTSSSLTKWLRDGKGLFWIKGKPGSGKSTLMKMLAQDDRTHQALCQWGAGTKPLLSSYFFWSQASAMENSDVGLFRSMLCDILTKPALCDVAFPDWEPKHAAHEPTFTDVSGAFKRLLASSALDHKLCVLIDGLDEYARDSMDRTKLVMLIFQLAQSPQIKFLVSSRPLQEFEAALHKQPCLIIHHFTKDCIRTIVTDTLRHESPLPERGRYEASDMDKLIEEVVSKSSGVFLWAVFAVRTLADGMSMGDRIEELQSRLAELPPELEELFTYMIQRITPRYRREAYRILRIAHHWYTNIKDPMPAIVLSFANEFENVRKSLSLADTSSLGPPPQRLERIEIRLRSCCLGLLEMSIGNKPSMLTGETGRPYVTGNASVQFMHKTVLDYLSDPKAWHEILPTQEAEFDVELAIMVSVVAAMKVHDEERAWHDWMRGVELVVQSNQRAEMITDSAYADILDSFDGVLSSVWTAQRFPESEYATAWKSDPVKDHWTNFLTDLEDFQTPADHHDNFLAFAVKCGFEKYVREKLQRAPGSVMSKRGRPLLDYAVYPLPSWSPIVGVTNPRLAKMLLDHGADTNESFEGYTPWTNALYSIRRSGLVPAGRSFGLVGNTDQRTYTDALETLEVLLAKGADAHAPCTLRVRRGPRTWVTEAYDLQQVLDRVLQTRCPCGMIDDERFKPGTLPFALCECALAREIRARVHCLRSWGSLKGFTKSRISLRSGEHTLKSAAGTPEDKQERVRERSTQKLRSFRQWFSK